MSNAPHSSQELQRMYEARFRGRLEYRDRVWLVLLRDYFQQFIDRGSVVLDLGAGYCEFINNVQCGKKYALDLNSDTKQKAHADVEVLSQDCAEPWKLEDGSLDIVFTSNFFEHLPDKPALARTLQEAKRCLKPGGRLIAMGPNIKYVPGAYWDFWDHHIPLTELSLAETLSHSGFSIEKCIAQFLPFTMASGPHYPPFFVSVYLRLPFAWRILGKQFLVIARKLA